MKKEDLDFMNDLDQAVHEKPSRATTLFLLVIAGLVFWLLIWISFAEVDERVRAQGQVMPSSDLQVVQSLEGGIVTDILVSEGDRVKKGQVLLRIDDVLFASEGRGIEAQLMSLQAKEVRLQAEASGKKLSFPADLVDKIPEIVENERKLYASRQNELQSAIQILKDEVKEAESNLAEINASINKLARSKELLTKELNITKGLVAKRAVPEIEQIRLERELNEVNGNLSTAYQSRKGLQAKLSATKERDNEKRSAFRSQALGELNEVQSRIASISESLNSVEDRVRRTELRAPVDGIVHRLGIRTEGGVVEGAQRLVEIVPVEDDLLIRARVNPADIAFLKPDQPVQVAITAYDPQIYGRLKGHLERIGADTVEDSEGNSFFEIDVRADKNYLGPAENPLPIAPGMIAEVEVITGKRTILTYLIKPVLRLRDRAFSEN